MALVTTVGIQRGNPLRVLALTRYGRMGASSRMRFEQFVPALAAFDVEVKVCPLLRDEYIARLYSKQPNALSQVFADYFKRLPWLFRARRFDLLWIEKELFPDLPSWFESLLSMFGIHYVVDYDDAIFHNYDCSANPWRRMLKSKIDIVMGHAAIVVCGNSYLADRAEGAGARRVKIIPTVIDLERYSIKRKPSSGSLVIGWIGSAATVKYLDVVLPAIRSLSEEFPIQLRVIGADIVVPGVDVVCSPWSERSEVEQIQEIDIGIMPLLDSPWERGKCGYKLIQYMACGVPVVASPVGVNEQIVQDGVSGYLASTAEDWIAAFRRMLTDGELRQRFGKSGRAQVESKFCMQVVAPQLAELMHEAAGKN